MGDANQAFHILLHKPHILHTSKLQVDGNIGRRRIDNSESLLLDVRCDGTEKMADPTISCSESRIGKKI